MTTETRRRRLTAQIAELAAKEASASAARYRGVLWAAEHAALIRRQRERLELELESLDDPARRWAVSLPLFT